MKKDIFSENKMEDLYRDRKNSNKILKDIVDRKMK
jgi:hypothetical protein